jgi:hypothetical protein
MNMMPKQQTATSNTPASKGSAWASACRHVTLPVFARSAATSSIVWLRSVATIVLRGMAAAIARVTIPVPAAVSRIARSASPRRSATASAKGWNRIGPRSRS